MKEELRSGVVRLMHANGQELGQVEPEHVLMAIDDYSDIFRAKARARSNQ